MLNFEKPFRLSVPAGSADFIQILEPWAPPNGGSRFGLRIKAECVPEQLFEDMLWAKVRVRDNHLSLSSRTKPQVRPIKPHQMRRLLSEIQAFTLLGPKPDEVFKGRDLILECRAFQYGEGFRVPAGAALHLSKIWVDVNQPHPGLGVHPDWTL